MEIADLLQLRDSGSSAVDSTNANERNRQFNRILIALQALGAAFETSFIGGAAAASYATTLASSAGTITSATATGRFLTVGRFTFVAVDGTIATNGTGSGFVTFTLPVAPNARIILTGRRSVVNPSYILQGIIDPASSTTVMFAALYDGTYPGADTARLSLNGWYENA